MTQSSSLRQFRIWPVAARVAVVLFALHVVLQFFPPLPPVTRGSLVSHALAFAFIVAAGLATARAYNPVLEAWQGLRVNHRIILALGAAALAGLMGAVVYRFAPGLFERFSAEEGVWEPLGTLCFLAAAILLYKTAQLHTEKRERRHLFFLAALFIFLFLEEINYLEIIGGILPRAGGEYIGAAHNLFDLIAEDLIGPGVAGALVLLAALLTFELWWIELFQPATLLRELRYPRYVFLALGIAMLVIAIGIEMRVIGWREGVQKPEELFEFIGAIFLLAFGLDVAAQWRRQFVSTNRIDRSTA